MSGHGADWYKREPGTYLGGIRGLPERLQCVYGIVIELIYLDGGRTLDNPKYIAGYIDDVGQAAVRKALDRLCELGKLYRRDGYLHNRKADEVARTKEQLSQIRAESARKADQNPDETEEKPDQKTLEFPENSSENPNENNGTGGANAPPARAREGEGEVELPAPNGAGTARQRSSRGTRIPDDFEPTPEMIEFALTECGLTDRDIRWHTNKFIDYWRAASGAKGTKKDWPATWRVWMRTESERKPNARQSNRPSSGGGLHDIARQDMERARNRRRG